VRAALSILLLCATLSAAPFRFADLEKIIQTKQITTIDELLPQLPEEYRRYYTFLYFSRSLQQKYVTPAEPRVILYGPEADFVMAFTNRDDALETLEFDPATSRFTFRSLDFTLGKPLDPPPVENPPLCLSCHGQDPRPNWDGYNMWPGAFGSMSRGGCDAIVAGTREFKDYTDFLAGKRTQDRYRHLVREAVPSVICPSDPKSEITVTNGVVSDANTDLTAKFHEKNLFRLKRLIEASPAFRAFRYVLASGGNQCLNGDTIEKFFPPQWAKNAGKPLYAEVLARVVANAKTDFATRFKFFNYHNKPSPTDSNRRPINFMDPDDSLGGKFGYEAEVTLLTLLVERMGLSMERLSLGFEHSQYDFTSPDVSPDNLFLLWTAAPDSVTGENYAALTCEQLQQKSVAAIAALPTH
jgi:hypothetical protein